jgi:hypothetical protein
MLSLILQKYKQAYNIFCFQNVKFLFDFYNLCHILYLLASSIFYEPFINGRYTYRADVKRKWQCQSCHVLDIHNFHLATTNLVENLQFMIQLGTVTTTLISTDTLLFKNWSQDLGFNSWLGEEISVLKSPDQFWNVSHPHLMPRLTFKGQILDISNAACTPQWPNVRYI